MVSRIREQNLVDNPQVHQTMLLFLDSKGRKTVAKEVSISFPFDWRKSILMYLKVSEVVNELQTVDATNTYYLMEPILLKSSIGIISSERFLENNY